MSEWEEVPGEVPRDRWSRPLIVPPGGDPKGKHVAYARCTTFVDVIDDKTTLTKWKLRMAVAGIVNRKDYTMRAASLGLPPVEDGSEKAATEAKKWRSEMDRLAEEGMEAAKASAAATIGTSLHAITEALDRGQEINLDTIPAEYHKHLANYQAATAPLTALGIEQFLVEDDLQIGGTADRFVRIDGHDGVFVADIKTGNVDFGQLKFAMQLAVYAHSEIYNPATGARTPIDGIRHDLGLIIHLDARTGDCALHWVDIAAGWEAVPVCRAVRDWRKRKGLFAPADFSQAALISAPAPAAPLVTAPEEFGRDAYQAKQVLEAIQQAGSRADIERIFAMADQIGLWSDSHTEAAKARISQLTAA